MSALDTPENAMWRERARNVADKVLRPLAKKYDDLQEYPWEIRDALAEAGLMRCWIPKEYGGEAGDAPNLNLALLDGEDLPPTSRSLDREARWKRREHDHAIFLGHD